MLKEIEVKFVNIDIEEIRQTLTKRGAQLCTPMRMMKRAVIDSPFMTADNAFLRVRDEGDKVSVTYKRFNPNDASDVQEHEITTDSYEHAVELFSCVGLHPRSYQESKRETWNLDDCEVVIDVWPWLKPYVEIEGESTESIQRVAENLGFSWSDVIVGDVMAAYRQQYSHLKDTDTIASIKQVRFDDDLPKLLRP